MPSIREVTINEAQRLANGGALMLDVRELDEWRAGHLAGAVHIPLGELDPAAIDPGRQIVTVCRSGNRSGKAATTLAEAGHEVVNMDGGMLAWHEAGLPMVATDGSPGTV